MNESVLLKIEDAGNDMLDRITCPIFLPIAEACFNNLLTHAESSINDKDFQHLISEKSAHRRDHRTPEMYLIDIYKGWLVEDSTFYLLKELIGSKFPKATVEQIGCDKERKININDISADPDIKILNNNKLLYLDVKAAYRNWQVLNIKPSHHVRSPRYYYLFYIIEEGKFFLCNPHIEGKTMKLCTGWGSKVAYQYTKEEYMAGLIEPKDLLLG